VAEHIETVKYEPEHIIKLKQSELNTIALMLGKSTDELVVEAGEDWNIEDLCTGSLLNNLYQFFYAHMKNNTYTNSNS
jgi:hypothetical protein